MKLIGSLTEDEYRKDLIKYSKQIFWESSNSTLRDVVLSKFPKLKTVYILSSFPDDTSEYYWLLVDGKKILHIELDKQNVNVPVVEFSELSEHLKNISKQGHIQILVAQELHEKQFN